MVVIYIYQGLFAEIIRNIKDMRMEQHYGVVSMCAINYFVGVTQISGNCLLES